MAEWTRRAVTPDEAVSCVQSGMRVFVHGAAATPTPLLEALARRRDLERRPALPPAHDGARAVRGRPSTPGASARSRSSPADPVRRADRGGARRLHPDLPLRHSRAVHVGARPARRRAAAALAARPPRLLHARHVGRRGARRAPQSARFVIAEINEQMPRTHGNTLVPLDRIDAVRSTPTARPPRARARPPDRRSRTRIGELVAALVARRRDAADGHRRHPRRRAAAARRQARPRRPHRDVLRRPRRSRRGGRRHQRVQARPPRPHR